MEFELATAAGAQAVILVEGRSDQAALEALAQRRGRVLGAEGVRSQGEIRSLRILQRQPAQRGFRPDRQLHRFIGTRSGRKSQYARMLVAALDLSRVPRPLDRVLAHV